mmetsp:Transcript_1471/g.1547  ORF Transcript_1471/g.1547 Transcript_1471/m.1547 type:complete len:274 (+) Transcript_1471:171-992(+)|eukprot:CAMPEP_0182421112 /NCGR_PEP_ID=MMETSP1167-20130531/6336_1 /TAXON_ID=2988 /ORGANISM="Mallomonas Sp, Strain CCMP3275" /LENGTH=273 /DNA_ID=CAMNT_0024597903 /DNA_START=59 /DNA_END=880 /DNA_ORIENTATION=+
MGTSSSSRYLADDKGTSDYYNRKPNRVQKMFGMRPAIPIELSVAHFTPTSFPIIPLINKNTTDLCTESWNKILNTEYKDENGVTTSGMTMFYNDFYERLDIFDSSGRFEAVLNRHSSGANKIAAKGAILIRIVKFVLKFEEDSKESQALLHNLGKSHNQKSIRPWQYSVFVQTLLMTIAYRLGTNATTDVMAAWVNLFAFVMKGMLPQSIKGQVDEDELNINTSDFGAQAVVQKRNSVIGTNIGLPIKNKNVKGAAYPDTSVNNITAKDEHKE